MLKIEFTSFQTLLSIIRYLWGENDFCELLHVFNLLKRSIKQHFVLWVRVWWLHTTRCLKLVWLCWIFFKYANLYQANMELWLLHARNILVNETDRHCVHLHPNYVWELSSLAFIHCHQYFSDGLHSWRIEFSGIYLWCWNLAQVCLFVCTQ